MIPLGSLKHLKAGVAAAVALAVLSSFVLACEKKGSSDTVMRLFELPEWRGLKPEYGDRFELRRESDGAGALLMKHSRREVVYSYDAERNTVTAVTDEEWQRARGTVAQCGQQFLKTEAMRVTQEHKLLAGGREIQAAGQTVLDAVESPSGRWVAVLSATGRAGTSVLPFSAGGGAAGQHYHQLLSLPDLIWKGKPARVPTPQDFESLIPCWSADEQFVLYRQINFNYLSVVKTDLPSTPNPMKVLK